MKIWQRLITLILWLTATTVAFGVPLWRIFDKLVIEHYEVTRARWSFAIAFVLMGVGLIGIKVLKAWYERKLQSIDVANELGVVGTTPLIIKRVLLLMQVAIPLSAFSLFLYGVSLIPDMPSYKIFLGFMYWFLGGFFIYLLHDVIKNHFYTRNAIAKALKMDMKKEQLKERRLRITR